jgi:hypothetical protein
MRTSLRSRFLTALATGSALGGVALGACGGSIDDPNRAQPAGSSGSSGGGIPTTTAPTKGPTPPVGSSGSIPKDASVIDAANVCEWGKPKEACYTHAQLDAMWKSPPQGGDVGGDAGPPPWDPNGCLPAESVRDDCCNIAVTGPTLNAGGSCCYVHCVGGCCGRPFVVDGAARVADVVTRDDWRSGEVILRDHALDADARKRIATAWANDAAMEHASVAAFARFTLELLALGAPSDLVLAAQHAAREEIEHARACFAIASSYAGRALGPGALDVGDAMPARSLAEVAAAAASEGCVGEALSAALAQARAARCRDDATRAVLERIADEEARHAELAWSFVGWAIAVGGHEVRASVASAFESARTHPPLASDPALRTIPIATLRAHGLLDQRTAQAVIARVLANDVGPCAAALAA